MIRLHVRMRILCKCQVLVEVKRRKVDDIKYEKRWKSFSRVFSILFEGSPKILVEWLEGVWWKRNSSRRDGLTLLVYGNLEVT